MSAATPDPLNTAPAEKRSAARNEAHAIGLILLSALAYSLLPVLGAYSLESLSPPIYVAKSFFQYAILQACVWIVVRLAFRKENAGSSRYIRHDPRTYATIIISGILIAASYTFLFTSFYMVNKAGASVLYEAWPILVTVGLPLFMRRRFERLTAVDFGYLALAFVGIILVIGGSADTETTTHGPSRDRSNTILGYMLAVSSGVTMAIAVIMKTHLMKALALNRTAIPVVVQVEATHRLAGGIVLLALAFMVTDVTLADMLRVDVSTAFAVVELVGASAFWFAIIATRRSIINLLWYLAPMLAVLWLNLLGLSTVSGSIVLGGALIIIANVLAQRRSNNAKRGA
jgi:drug/metabolite transporter (DMT)-like permease